MAEYKSIYLASSWRNLYQPKMIKLLRDAGHQVYDFRNPPNRSGFAWSDLDTAWEGWTVHQYLEHLIYHPEAEAGFEEDMTSLLNCDIVVLLLPSERSAHSEAAFHKGRGMPVIIHIPEPVEPELMYKMFNAATETPDDLVRLLKEPLCCISARRLTALPYEPIYCEHAKGKG